jgi:hypothetical protein
MPPTASGAPCWGPANTGVAGAALEASLIDERQWGSGIHGGAGHAIPAIGKIDTQDAGPILPVRALPVRELGSAELPGRRLRAVRHYDRRVQTPIGRGIGRQLLDPAVSDLGPITAAVVDRPARRGRRATPVGGHEVELESAGGRWFSGSGQRATRTGGLVSPISRVRRQQRREHED